MSDTPFAGPRDIRKDGTGTVSYGLDDGMIVEFYEEPLHLEYMSKQVGHPIFRMQIMTRIMQPGNRNTIWVHATKGISYDMVIDPESGEYHTDWDVMEQCENGDPTEPVKYPSAWNRFLKKGISADSGIPIEQWAAVTRSYAESLKMQNVHTVQALAGLSDQAAQNIMGAIKYRDLAKAYLSEGEKNRIVAREQERASAAEEQNKQLLAKVEALTAQVLALQSKIAGGQVVEGAGRIVGSQEPIGKEIRQMSVKNANKRHKIPPADQAA